jgi:formate hydrogenlyase subunit 4
MRPLDLFFQVTACIVCAPLVSGLVTKMKNNFRMRQGPGLLQPYYNLVKLFAKEEVVSETTSWIFRAAPFVVAASTFAAAALVPMAIGASPMQRMGDFLALVFIFALGRFFLALAALDAGSAFGGMGSSREMFIASLVEPALCLVVFSLSLQFGSTDVMSFAGNHALSVSSISAGSALFLITLAETSRVPVDNQETHLELTMVHEAMALEYSGRSLALLELASYVKQMIMFFLIAQIVFPLAAPQPASLMVSVAWCAWYAARLGIVAVLVAAVEVSVAKMRLFRVADFLGFAFVLGIVATVCAMLGV